MNDTRVPPHDLHLERALIGVCLLQPLLIDEAAALLMDGDLYHPQHQTIWDAMVSLHHAGQPVDALTVTDRILSSGTPIGDSTIGAVLDVQADAGYNRSAARYARTVAGLGQLRRLQAVCKEVLDRCYERLGEPEDILEWAQQAVYDVGAERRSLVEPITIQAAIAEFISDLETNPGTPAGIVSTGLRDLDDKIIGLRPGQLVTVAGRPGMGKSLLGSQIAVHAASAGQPTMFVTIEMSVPELTERIIGAEARVDLQRLRTRTLINQDWDRISPTIDKLDPTPLFILDDPGATIASIRAQARRLSAGKTGLSLIVVDYLQLMTATSKRDNRQVEVAEMSSGLKRLARDLGVPVVALAQLNRSLEMRADKRPTLSDLRESGAIENDSDVVIGIYRDDYYDPDSPDRGTAELIVLKQRNGPTGSATVSYLGHHGLFVDMARI